MKNLSRRHVVSMIGATAIASLTSDQFAYAATSGVTSLTRFTVVDLQTGKTLVDREENKRRHPASLTKMLTAALVFEAMADPNTDFNLNSSIIVPETINLVGPGSARFEKIKPGMAVPAKDLLIGMGGRSDAHSTITLATHLGSPEVYDWGGSNIDKLYHFIDLMNEKAAQIGMNDSHFSVVTGLPYENHYSTTHDLSLLMQYIEKNFPRSAEITFGQPTFDIPDISDTDEHTSRLIRSRPDNVLWAKTGWTEDAGYCLACIYQKDGYKMAAVLTGCDGRDHRNSLMLEILTQAYMRAGFSYPEYIPVPFVRPENLASNEDISQAIDNPPLPRPNPRYTR